MAKFPTVTTFTTLTKTRITTPLKTCNVCPKANIKLCTCKPATAMKNESGCSFANTAGANTSDMKAATTPFAPNNAATKAVWKHELALFAENLSKPVVGKKQNIVRLNVPAKRVEKTKQKSVQVAAKLSMHVGISAHKNIVRSSAT